MFSCRSRRRFLAICAAAPAAIALPRAALARRVWTGIALGAEASIQLDHPDAAEADAALAACTAELRRLEAVFSLYDPQSALSRLNRDGRLAAAPVELVALLERAFAFSALSGGAFDVTVQPLWALHAARFRATGRPPSDQELAAALARVNWRGINLDNGNVRLAPGTEVTLNGIAQGFITDRVAELLKARGFRHVLVDLGEARALGPRGDGKGWRIALPDPKAPETTLTMLTVAEGAVATSGGYGQTFGAGITHLLDPRTGRSPAHWASVTVQAPDATTADALSTTMSIAPPDSAAAILTQGGGTRAILVAPSGRMRTIAA